MSTTTYVSTTFAGFNPDAARSCFRFAVAVFAVPAILLAALMLALALASLTGPAPELVAP